MKHCPFCDEVLGINERHDCPEARIALNPVIRTETVDPLDLTVYHTNTRPSLHEYMMSFALLAASRSTCLKKNHGAVLVRNKQIISTGYNGACRNEVHCTSTGKCLRKDCAPGTGYEKCVAVHAEMNAITQAAKHGISVEGSVLYITGVPCILCARIIINAGIIAIYYIDDGRYADGVTSIKMLQNADISTRIYVGEG